MECLIFYVLNPKSMRFVFMLALAYWSRGSSNQDRIHLRVSKSCFFEKWFKCFRFHQFGCAFLVKAMDRKIIETVRNISCNYNIFQNSLWEDSDTVVIPHKIEVFPAETSYVRSIYVLCPGGNPVVLKL